MTKSPPKSRQSSKQYPGFTIYATDQGLLIELDSRENFVARILATLFTFAWVCGWSLGFAYEFFYSFHLETLYMLPFMGIGLLIAAGRKTSVMMAKRSFANQAESIGAFPSHC